MISKKLVSSHLKIHRNTFDILTYAVLCNWGMETRSKNVPILPIEDTKEWCSRHCQQSANNQNSTVTWDIQNWATENRKYCANSNTFLLYKNQLERIIFKSTLISLTALQFDNFDRDDRRQDRIAPRHVVMGHAIIQRVHQHLSVRA